MASAALQAARVLCHSARPITVRIFAAKRIRLCGSLEGRAMSFVAQERGSPNTLDHRIYISKYYNTSRCKWLLFLLSVFPFSIIWSFSFKFMR